MGLVNSINFDIRSGTSIQMRSEGPNECSEGTDEVS